MSTRGYKGMYENFFEAGRRTETSRKRTITYTDFNVMTMPAATTYFAVIFSLFANTIFFQVVWNFFWFGHIVEEKFTQSDWEFQAYLNITSTSLFIVSFNFITLYLHKKMHPEPALLTIMA